MGFRVLLIAVTGKTPEVIHSEYGVTPTGEHEDIPESPVAGALLPSGAYVLYINDDIEPDERVLARLSANARLLVCYVNETVMASYTASWANGTEQWSMIHDADKGNDHLETSGDVPEQLSAARDRLQSRQEATPDADHVFDIPIELFVASGGMRYDEDIPDAGPNPWQVLARTKRKGGWWPFK